MITGANESNWCEPDAELYTLVRDNAQLVSKVSPVRVVSLGGTDARLWRMRGVPAVVYGPSPDSMGVADENVTIEEFLHVVKTHVLSAYDYLKAN